MQGIMEVFKQQFLMGDGAMGTMLQAKGLPAGESPEVWMLSHPDKILEISEAYVKVGAKIIESNSFGASRLKLAEFGCQDSVSSINMMAVKLARQAAGHDGYVAGIIGPSGQFPAPIGALSFDELTDVFAQQAQALSLAGADIIYLQTFSDLGEARAAYLGARKVTNIPIAVSLTYGQNQRTLTGTDPETAAAVFTALGADMLGANCSAGPAEILEVIDRYRKCCKLPLLAEANAGMPVLTDGRSHFPMTPEAMASYVPMLLESGVRWLGGCCGTTPQHIKEMAETAKTWEGQVIPGRQELPAALASRSRTIYLGGNYPPRLIGERINPTARKVLAQALVAGDYSLLVREGANQLKAGTDLLDVNTGLAGGDEVKNLSQTILGLQQSLDCPLVIDTVNPQALEKALIHYHGKALINSVNGEAASMDAVLPLAKQYGAAVLGLTLDEKGIPDKAEDRLAIAERILERALEEGIAKENVFIDCLVLAAATDPKLAASTLKAITLVKEKLGLVTVLGLSNISHGMPKRPWLNHTFLAQALAAGLDAVIANPLDAGIRQTLAAGAFLTGRDPHGNRYIEQTKKEEAFAAAEAEAAVFAAASAAPAAAVAATASATAADSPASTSASTSPSPSPSPSDAKPAAEQKPAETAGSTAAGALPQHMLNLQQAILINDQQRIRELIKPLTAEKNFIELVDQSIIPALEQAGDTYARGITFLPQLLLTADGAAFAFDYLKVAMPADAPKELETVVLGAVAGDIHDIGKNIVKALLSSYGYNIIDLGKSVPAQEFVRAVKEHNAQVLGLSALMTTTMTEMEPVIRAIRAEGLDTRILVGGAVLTEEYAASIKADAYIKDGAEAHGIIRRLLD